MLDFKNINKKYILLNIIGLLLTVASFLLYYLLQPNTFWIIIICIVDFLFLCINVNFVKPDDEPFYKIFIYSAIILTIFIILAFAILLIISVEFFKDYWLIGIYSAIFLCPSATIVIILIAFILNYV